MISFKVFVVRLQVRFQLAQFIVQLVNVTVLAYYLVQVFYRLTNLLPLQHQEVF